MTFGGPEEQVGETVAIDVPSGVEDESRKRTRKRVETRQEPLLPDAESELQGRELGDADCRRELRAFSPEDHVGPGEGLGRSLGELVAKVS